MGQENNTTAPNAEGGIPLQDLLRSLWEMYTESSLRDPLASTALHEDLSLLTDSEELPAPVGKRDRLLRPLRAIWNGPLHPADDAPPPIAALWQLEMLPQKLQLRLSKRVRLAVLVGYLCLWCALCYSILIPYLTVPPGDANDPSALVVPVSCLGQPKFWNGKNGRCGLDGALCPSLADEEVVFRCPALCDRGLFTFSMIPIGDQQIKYRGYYVGGGALDTPQRGLLSHPYRADSFPCGAAIHSGAISPFYGGCARIKYTGLQPHFRSTEGRFGVEVSIPFLSFFHQLFSFKELGLHYRQCYDPRLLALVINIVLGVPVVYLASGAVAYWTITMVGFWTIALATDPPLTVDATNFENFAELILLCLGRLLPTAFMLYVLWHCLVKRTLTRTADDNQSALWRVFLFYPLFWLGILNNITFDRLPVDRLTVQDLQTQPGALVAVSSIVGLIAVCAIVQAYKIWLSGRFRKYLMVYLLFVLGLAVVAVLPGLTLRIHHYILALLLIPGCATRGKTALMFQGILLGLFLSGASRWGLAAIAETAGLLKRNDPKGTFAPPALLAFNATLGMLTWNDTDPATLSPMGEALLRKYNAFSLLINDVERLVVPKDTHLCNLTELLHTEKLAPLVEMSLRDGFKDANGDIPIYLRIGRKIMGGSSYTDFAKAAVLKYPSGQFTPAGEGVT